MRRTFELQKNLISFITPVNHQGNPPQNIPAIAIACQMMDLASPQHISTDTHPHTSTHIHTTQSECGRTVAF